MSNRTMNVCATMIALALAGTAAGQTQTGLSDPSTTSPPPVTTSASSQGQTRVAGKFSAPFITMAGSPENATALANALRTGSPATLTYTSIGANGKITTTTTTITPSTKPMGWGNVKHSLALAQFSLNQAGITNPTGAQLQAALEGGSVKTADGKIVTFAGVLQQRADGMGWGQIAHTYGTTMGAVNHGMKAPPIPVATTTPPPSTKPGIPTKTTNSDATAARGVTTAGGTSTQGDQSARGITTAGGSSAGAGQGKGLTTASGDFGRWGSRPQGNHHRDRRNERRQCRRHRQRGRRLARERKCVWTRFGDGFGKCPRCVGCGCEDGRFKRHRHRQCGRGRSYHRRSGQRRRVRKVERQRQGRLTFRSSREVAGLTCEVSRKRTQPELNAASDDECVVLDRSQDRPLVDPALQP